MTPHECATAAEAILAAGGDPVVVDGATEIGTQEAADLLGVSRPTLIGILDRREIPFHRIGVHRRLKVADVLRYREERRARQSAALDRLIADELELDLPD